GHTAPNRLQATLPGFTKGGQGGRVHLGRDTRPLTASRRRWWKATQTIQTVYRKESSACGEAATCLGPPSGTPLGSLSYSWPGRPSSPRPRHTSPNRLQATLVEGYSDNPNRIPEGEQARREAAGRSEETM